MVLEVIETESHFLSENIYLNKTERLRKVRAEGIKNIEFFYLTRSCPRFRQQEIWVRD